MGLFLSILAFVLSWQFGRRSLGVGMVVVLAVGYSYGLVRARVSDGFSHFMFDAAVLGLYAARFVDVSGLTRMTADRSFYQWVGFLIGWPFVVLAIGIVFPVPFLIQLVGLRAAIWFLPFLLIGTQMGPADLRVITRGLALFNLVALAFGLAEYFFGIEPFLPRNAATELIHRSKDIAGYEYHRIPSTFVAAAAYGGVMVASWPFLAGRWAMPGIALEERLLLTAGLVAAGLGVFLCGSRSPVVMFFLVAGFTVYQLRSQLGYILLFALLGAGVGYVVAGNERLQRFTSLQDSEAVVERMHGSANLSILELLSEYPMGGGLGSAFGTSVPSFLQHLAPQDPIGAENEYARIGTEQGVVGLCLWIAFLIWFFARTAFYRGPGIGHHYSLTLLYLLMTWGFAWLGTGLLVSVPGTAILLFQMGWLGRRAGQRTEILSRRDHGQALGFKPSVPSRRDD
jgi:hypothetical protein